MKKEPPENGLHIEHYDDGQLKFERNFKDGELHGKYTSWYESGQKKSEENYEDGELHGKYTSWYESGQKKSEENYEDGEASGRWFYWNENGKIEAWSSYKLRNYKKFIKPHIVLILILITIKIILEFWNLSPFYSLFSDPIILVAGALSGIFGLNTYKQLLKAIVVISIVAIAIIDSQTLWVPIGESIFTNIVRFIDILLIALSINIIMVAHATNSHFGTRSIKNRWK
jgi:hypothetical protein